MGQLIIVSSQHNQQIKNNTAFIFANPESMKRFQQILSPKPLNIKKISCFQQFPERPQVSDSEDLATIEAYINSNIQSKRKKIISLYAISMTGQKGVEDINIPSFATTRQEWPKSVKRKYQYSLQPISPTLHPIKIPSQLPNDDPNFVVSNRFPSKQRPKDTIFRLHMNYPIKTIKKDIAASRPKEKTKQTAESDFKQYSQVESVLPQKRRNGSVEYQQKPVQTNQQINPWEYLVFAHEHSLCEL